VGGPAPGKDHFLPGVVVVTSGGRTVARQTVAEGAEFRFSLPPGTYRLSVGDDGKTCQHLDVTVAGGSDQTVDLVCRLK
jgi:hypothetical protein